MANFGEMALCRGFKLRFRGRPSVHLSSHDNSNRHGTTQLFESWSNSMSCRWLNWSNRMEKGKRVREKFELPGFNLSTFKL